MAATCHFGGHYIWRSLYLAVIVAVGIGLPSSHLGSYLGFTQLPFLYWPLLGLTAVSPLAKDSQPTPESQMLLIPNLLAHFWFDPKV